MRGLPASALSSEFCTVQVLVGPQICPLYGIARCPLFGGLLSITRRGSTVACFGSSIVESHDSER